MHTAGQHDDRLAAQIPGHHFASMAGDGAFRKAWNIRIRDADRVYDLIHQHAEAGAEHDGCAGNKPIQAFHQNVDDRVIHFTTRS